MYFQNYRLRKTLLGKCLKSAISEHRSSPNMRLFLNTWTLDGKYSLRNCDNYGNQFKCSYLRSKKKNSQFFAAILKLTSNFEHFEKKYDAHRLCISEITNCETS